MSETLVIPKIGHNDLLWCCILYVRLSIQRVKYWLAIVLHKGENNTKLKGPYETKISASDQRIAMYRFEQRMTDTISVSLTEILKKVCCNYAR